MRTQGEPRRSLAAISDRLTRPESGKYVIDANTLGKLGENIATRWLVQQGFKVDAFHTLLYRRRKCAKFGALVELCRKDCWSSKNIWNYPFPPFCQERSWSDSVIWAECKRYLFRFCPQVCQRMCKGGKVSRIVDEVRGKYEAPGLDFVAYLGRDIYVVEVKTGVEEPHGGLKPGQRELARRLAEELGIRLLEIRIGLDNQLDYSVRSRVPDFSLITSRD